MDALILNVYLMILDIDNEPGHRIAVQARGSLTTVGVENMDLECSVLHSI